MFKLSFFILLLTIPLLNSNIYYGLPLWAYASLGTTIIYAIILIFVIEKKWHTLRDKNE